MAPHAELDSAVGNNGGGRPNSQRAISTGGDDLFTVDSPNVVYTESEIQSK
jgi:hypothetical protein